MRPAPLMSVSATAAMLLLASDLAAAQSFELKIAHFVPPTHPVAAWIERWSQRLEKESNGQLKFQIFPNMQLGPPPKHFDLVRTGQADVSWFLHGFTPGRFPLTEISNLPYMIGSGEIGAKVLNDPQLRGKYLEGEHQGVKILLLMTHQPGNIHTGNKPIRTVEDMKGQRHRFSSPPVRDFISALGGTPVGMPPTQMVEAMQRGTLDGMWIDYGGAMTFRIGPVTKYTTEVYAYVTSFCICMNPRSYERLPANLRKLIDDSFVGVEKEIGEAWDGIDETGKADLMKAGMTPIRLSKEEDARFRAIGAQVTEAKVKELEEKGLPARAVHDLMKTLADQHARTSRNFWTQ